jgi:hypothetical protein
MHPLTLLLPLLLPPINAPQGASHAMVDATLMLRTVLQAVLLLLAVCIVRACLFLGRLLRAYRLYAKTKIPGPPPAPTIMGECDISRHMSTCIKIDRFVYVVFMYIESPRPGVHAYLCSF